MTETDIPAHEIVLQLLNRSIEQNDQILKRLALSDQKLDQHMVDEEKIIKGIIAAFSKKPDGSPDYEGHAIYHTALIEESLTRTRFYRELQHDLIKNGIWGLIAVLGILIVYWWNGHVPTK